MLRGVCYKQWLSVQDEYQRDRDERAKLRQQMIRSIHSTTVSTMHDIQLVMSTMRQITRYPSEITRTSQVADTTHF